jgi:heme-degrading monooxygenase HmoA
MVLEIARFDIQPGQEEAFVAAYEVAVKALQSAPGCRSVRMTRGVESPSRFTLLVEWDSVEAHEQNFRATDRFTTWRGHIGPFFAGPPAMEHFIDVSVTDPT